MDKSIKVTNSSNNIISFFVTYNLNGKTILNNPESGFGQNVSRIIKIPPNATNIHITIRSRLSLDPRVWFIFFRKSMPIAMDKCFIVSGARYKPTCKEVSC